ncbi:MAG: hypothetical protein JJE52_05345 [Acidimicrobiia bacterium]|nr:hypothetical protein [Acidimicrobiia bacterium]
MRIFVAVNGWSWDPHPDVDDSEATVMAIASGDFDEASTAEWLRRHLIPPPASE